MSESGIIGRLLHENKSSFVGLSLFLIQGQSRKYTAKLIYNFNILYCQVTLIPRKLNTKTFLIFLCLTVTPNTFWRFPTLLLKTNNKVLTQKIFNTILSKPIYLYQHYLLCVLVPRILNKSFPHKQGCSNNATSIYTIRIMYTNLHTLVSLIYIYMTGYPMNIYQISVQNTR